MSGYVPPEIRRARTQSVGRAVSGLTKKALDKRGFVDAAIINEWPAIAGELIGSHSLPDRIRFQRDRTQPGTLYLILENGALATEVVHFQPVLLERINRFFGFRAVGDIKIIHGPLPKPAKDKRPPLPALQPERRSEIEHNLANVDDPELRDALNRLGQHVARRRASEEAR
ncbi:MAG: DciA family protein [Rhodospirillales bacterium]